MHGACINGQKTDALVSGDPKIISSTTIKIPFYIIASRLQLQLSEIE